MVNNFNSFVGYFKYDTISNRDGFHPKYNRDSGKLVVSNKGTLQAGIYQFISTEKNDPANPIFRAN
jgi:hypothetical protein